MPQCPSLTATRSRAHAGAPAAIAPTCIARDARTSPAGPPPQITCSIRRDGEGMMTLPADKFAEKLARMGRKVRKVGDHFDAQCPAHADRMASLSIGTGDDGRLLLHCHSGCSFNELLDAVGMNISEAFSPTQRVNGHANGKRLPPKAWPTLEGAVAAAQAWIAKDVGTAVEAGCWMYHQGASEAVAAVVRFDLPEDRKSFRPFHRVEAGWAMGDPPGKWPLYRLLEIGGSARVYVCEGEKAADAAVACGLSATTSAHGANAAANTDWRPVAGVEVVLIPDNDQAGELYARDVAAELRSIKADAVVKVLRLREMVEGEFPEGGDFVEFARDFRDGQEAEAIQAEVERAAGGAELFRTEADPTPSPRASSRIFIDPKAPLATARLFLQSIRTHGGCDVLRFYAGDWYLWGGISYRVMEDVEARQLIYRWCEAAWTRVQVGDDIKELPFAPTKPKVDLIIDALKTECHVRNVVTIPCWLDGRAVDPRDCIACSDGIIHLPTYISARQPYLEPLTPVYFSTCALPFPFLANTAAPAEWHKFLNDIFDGDAEAVACLQEWFGYCLTADTRQQKMLLLYGPKRGGKGTIARILTGLLGAQNVANPTLSSLTTNFGLWPLVGKTLAIVGDARLSGRSDQSIITERLLSISGEDALTIDRKNREPITQRLPTRIMLLSNELPKLTDASGALASRFVILRLKKSFYGAEDLQLGDRLTKELPGILLWAIDGWRGLQERRRFTVPASSTAAVRELDELASPIIAFARERLCIAAGRRTEVKELYRGWVEWCLQQGREHAGTIHAFGRDLSAAFPGVEVVQHRVGGFRIRSYEGVGWGGDA